MIVPSIDIKNGKVVQLKQGREVLLECDRDPIDLAREFNRFGEIAVIDLDAAMEIGDNLELIKQICKVADVRVGGGIRDSERARQLLKCGAKQLIFGTAANPELLSQFPSYMVMVALDQREGTVFDKGWQQSTGESLIARAGRLSPYCDSFLSTFIDAEGQMGGMSLEAIKQLQEQLKKPLTVAGGVSSTSEIIEISRLGVDVQVGMALYTGRIDLVEAIIGSVRFNGQGLCPTIVQDQHGQVLMFAYSSIDSLRRALTDGKGVYFSRSRQTVWEKGLTSGCTQRLISCRVDCDLDTLIFTIEQTKVACHTGNYSCFGKASSARKFSLGELFETLKERKGQSNNESFSSVLFRDRQQLLAKIAEESNEVINFTSKENLRWEIADLLYCLSLLAVAEGIEWNDVENELAGRRRW
jgi:phosphoribosyl-ATP pyrophosphohydrolase